jgi:hypothetical protein
MLRCPSFRLGGLIAAAIALGGCGGDTLVDDYRESWAVIRGRVLDQTDRPVAGATIRVAPVKPPFAQGDTVVSGADGSYLTRVSSFGVSSFRADVRLSATAPSGATVDTLVTGLYVAERDRGGKPDTLTVSLRVRP